MDLYQCKKKYSTNSIKENFCLDIDVTDWEYFEDYEKTYILLDDWDKVDLHLRVLISLGLWISFYENGVTIQ